MNIFLLTINVLSLLHTLKLTSSCGLSSSTIQLRNKHKQFSQPLLSQYSACFHMWSINFIFKHHQFTFYHISCQLLSHTHRTKYSRQALTLINQISHQRCDIHEQSVNLESDPSDFHDLPRLKFLRHFQLTS